MIFVSFAWLGEHDTQESFEANTPFAFLGQQLQSMHFAGRFVILVLDGYDRLSPFYRAQLKALGLELIDYGPDTRQLRSRFHGLDRFDVTASSASSGGSRCERSNKREQS